jgi:hypothetical protein
MPPLFEGFTPPFPGIWTGKYPFIFEPNDPMLFPPPMITGPDLALDGVRVLLLLRPIMIPHDSFDNNIFYKSRLLGAADPDLETSRVWLNRDLSLCFNLIHPTYRCP